MKKDFEMEKKLLEANFNNKIQLAEAQVASEKMKTVELEKQVASLKAQLDMAQKDIKEISTKALESASGRETINSLQKALENQPRNMK
jgi:predicted RNase H-like nuclease (RuvC/YqgF family)